MDRALGCLGNQTVLPYEIVIVHRHALSRATFDAEHPLGDRLRFVHQPSLPSLACARNRGMAVATGNVILFMNESVVLDPKFIEEILKP